jgi:hypothetical protein
MNLYVSHCACQIGLELARLVQKLKNSKYFEDLTHDELRLLGLEWVWKIHPHKIQMQCGALPPEFLDAPLVKLLLPCPTHPPYGVTVIDTPPPRYTCTECIREFKKEHPGKEHLLLEVQRVYKFRE